MYKGYQIVRTDFNRINSQLKQHPYVRNSYFLESSPENGYEVKFPAKLEISSNAYSGSISKGDFKVFVKCSGADSPRPIRMVRNDKGFWKAKEWSSIVMGIRPPAVKIDDDL